MREAKVLIGIPCLGDISVDTFISILKLRDQTKYVNSVHVLRDTYLHHARNKLIWQAVNNDCTHILFVDSDMEFPPYALDSLIERKLDIVGGLYVSRKYEKINIIKKRTFNDKGEYVLKDITDIPSFTQPFEVDVVGTGFLLIDMNVFEQIEPPFFFHIEPQAFKLKSVPFPDNELGEDVCFCLYAKENGYKIWCDPTIPIGHSGNKIYRHTQYKSLEKPPEGNIE